MPEGHTLHRLALDLTDAFAGRTVAASSPQGRFEDGAGLLDGRVLVGADAWGKHLFCSFEGTELRLHVHLGLYGKLAIRHADDLPGPVGQVRLRLVAGPSADGVLTWADLRGATACELLTPEEHASLVARLGPDPLREDAEPERAWDRIGRSRTSIAALLMQQDVVAGIGNVYRAELLFRHRIDPFREGRSLRPGRWSEMWGDLVDLMALGVEKNRIETVRPEHEDAAREAARLYEGGRRRRSGLSYVYRRADQPCLVCSAKVRTIELAGRNLFWCPRCQRRFVPRGS
ncbi:DNA-formamidopyrimidine glycosylase family protein [Nocardioides sp. GY 10127]|uniref:Fpg/Nei family DNA glycosylase n=1 Tax=Nocardioides sp. GY 10127 TaxID=2569762 RepID=UPI0010A833A8|nr:DNA-formamidopyrimidine glycosylase family protein [Nocardioides sp. GY 10127]TIC80733.1 Fpg/Nei family DNA glycosylase [Nocardioides sp. GY 10127]